MKKESTPQKPIAPAQKAAVNTATQTPPKKREKCVGHVANGDRCKLYPIQGSTVCHKHGGKAQHIRRKAAERVAIEKVRLELTKIGIPIEVDLAETLLKQIREAAGNVEFLRLKVQGLDGEEVKSSAGLAYFDLKRVEHAKVVMELYNAERDRLNKYIETCTKLGIADRQIKLAEQQGELMATLTIDLLNDPSLGLSEDQKSKGRLIAAQLFGRLAGS